MTPHFGQSGAYSTPDGSWLAGPSGEASPGDGAGALALGAPVDEPSPVEKTPVCVADASITFPTHSKPPKSPSGQRVEAVLRASPRALSDGSPTVPISASAPVTPASRKSLTATFGGVAAASEGKVRQSPHKQSPGAKMQARAIISLANLREEMNEKEKRWGDALAEAEAELLNARRDASKLRLPRDSSNRIFLNGKTPEPDPSLDPTAHTRLLRAEAEVARLSCSVDTATKRAADAEHAKKLADKNAAFYHNVADSAALEVKRIKVKLEAAKEEMQSSSAREKDLWSEVRRLRDTVEAMRATSSTDSLCPDTVWSAEVNRLRGALQSSEQDAREARARIEAAESISASEDDGEAALAAAVEEIKRLERAEKDLTARAEVAEAESSRARAAEKSAEARAAELLAQIETRPARDTNELREAEDALQAAREALAASASAEERANRDAAEARASASERLAKEREEARNERERLVSALKDAESRLASANDPVSLAVGPTESSILSCARITVAEADPHAARTTADTVRMSAAADRKRADDAVSEVETLRTAMCEAQIALEVSRIDAAFQLAEAAKRESELTAALERSEKLAASAVHATARVAQLEADLEKTSANARASKSKIDTLVDELGETRLAAQRSESAAAELQDLRSAYASVIEALKRSEEQAEKHAADVRTLPRNSHSVKKISSRAIHDAADTREELEKVHERSPSPSSFQSSRRRKTPARKGNGWEERGIRDVTKKSYRLKLDSEVDSACSDMGIYDGIEASRASVGAKSPRQFLRKKHYLQTAVALISIFTLLLFASRARTLRMELENGVCVEGVLGFAIAAIEEWLSGTVRAPFRLPCEANLSPPS